MRDELVYLIHFIGLYRRQIVGTSEPQPLLAIETTNRPGIIVRLSTRAHGVLHYNTAAVLIVVPAIVLLSGGSSDGTVSEWSTAMGLLFVVGVLILGLALLTRYELGIVRAVPMAGDIAVDIVVGLVLIASPWVLGFADLVWWPHVAVGVLAIASAALTRPTSAAEDPAYATNPNAAKV
jgi:hypothetical protein